MTTTNNAYPPLAFNPTCEHRENPLGILESAPRLGWQVGAVESGARGVVQRAYRILVSDRQDQLAADEGNYWNSGWVESSESLWIPYGGRPLPSRRELFWKVRLRDDAGREGPWSEVARWRMGVLDSDEHAGEWIQYGGPSEGADQPDPREAAADFRTSIQLEKPVRRAFVRYMALGFADVRINGVRPDPRRRVGPPFTNPQFRVKEVTEEVTGLLREGENVLAVVLGNGYQRPPSGAWNDWQLSPDAPRFLLELEIEFADGSRRLLGSGPDWRNRLGPIVHNDFWLREAWDLRRLQPGWDAPGFDDSGWGNAVSASAPAGRRVASHERPARIHGEVRAVRREGNRYVFDGMYTGYPRLRVSGRTGEVVRIRGEQGHEVKGFGPLRVDVTLAADGEQWIEPLFTVHTIGPEFTVEGLEQLPEPEDVRIVPVHGDLVETGVFECSNPLWNKLHAIGRRTHLNYVLHYPMDPTREKAGWSQDIQNMFDTASYLTDSWRMYAAWWRDFGDTQLEDGYVSSVAPTHAGLVRIWNDPWWGGMICYTPWRLYEWYGDRAILEEAYEPMKRWVDYLTRLAADSADGLLYWAGASDWIEVGIEWWGPPKRTPKYLVSTLAWHLYATQVTRTAKLLGHEEDAAAYEELAEHISGRFNRILFDPETGLYAGATDSQAALIMPLAMGVVPEASREKVLGRLLANIRERGDHLSTGFVSNPYLLHGLTDLGHADVVSRIVNQEDHPSFYSTAAHGVFMETWRGGMAQMPSLGGPCVAWFYRAVLGIRNDPAHPGFARFAIHPEPVAEVDWARGHYESPRGRIGVDWRKEDGCFSLAVEVPGNTRAVVHLPACEGDVLSEGGNRLEDVPGLVDLGWRGGCRVVEIGSGRYSFFVRTGQGATPLNRETK